MHSKVVCIYNKINFILFGKIFYDGGDMGDNVEGGGRQGKSIMQKWGEGCKVKKSLRTTAQDC